MSFDTFRKRLTDRDRLPRRLWFPADPGTTSPDWADRYAEISQAIRRTLIAMLGYGVFCAVTLFQPDRVIFVSDGIRIPFANTVVDFSGFVVFGPLILVGLLVYLQIFVEQWFLLRRQPEAGPRDGPAFIFNLQGRVAALLSAFLFYWMAPIVLLLFARKGEPLPTAGVFAYFLFGWTTAILIFLQLRRCPASRRKYTNTVLWPLLVVFASTPVIYFVGDENALRIAGRKRIVRRVNLIGAQLAKKDLSGFRLDGAWLIEADLQGADLTSTELLRAVLARAVLRNASLWGADLRDSNLVAADLTGANLANATLTGADLADATLSGADLDGADLDGASLFGVKGLTCERLRQADPWQAAFRDDHLACGAEIPALPECYAPAAPG